jgi:hypothetical protein
MNTPQVVILSRVDLQDQLNKGILYGFRHMDNIRCHQIRNNIKNSWKEINISEPETYLFLGEEIGNKHLIGLYKSDINHIYIVKSFLDTILTVVPFNRKYFEY